MQHFFQKSIFSPRHRLVLSGKPLRFEVALDLSAPDTPQPPNFHFRKPHVPTDFCLQFLAGEYAVCKLPSNAPLEPWMAMIRRTQAQSANSATAFGDRPAQLLRSISITGDEISLVWDAESAVDLLPDSPNAETTDRETLNQSSSTHTTTPTGDQTTVQTSEQLIHPKIELGWNCFRIAGSMPFELVGVVSAITSVLAEAKISVFVVSTYDTDYILIKSIDKDAAILCCQAAGYTVASEPLQC